ncbi:SCP-2 sterol transfer family protein [Sodalis glossinidius str. 'morsitans']|uniref:Ubiquinone biosynthesis accessory factor UbiT n=1 Tax=Sodalis glossinidius (strain morsitans) TaxID=343509 RepID=Q2NW15_SODGM|nr:SCP2 sterol-binding domain-containing protein [Sodalis glossinidius]BAE73660.1 conserved hypothetical protein [Sodalis glossinidius str. 'morsitans']CRL44068.1 SCP-2 sterol transfer family protein [Sodalis glossinidius str. 'morsitans']
MWDKLRAQLVRRGPSLLRLPIKLTPFAVRRQVLEQVLHWQFRSALAEGELDFLEGRWLQIEVVDLGIFSSQANDLLLIAAGREDPDTLFFQPRLRIEGDTQLGLWVKNLLDAGLKEDTIAADGHRVTHSC